MTPKLTLMELAKKGIATKEIKTVAKEEGIPQDDLLELVAKGFVVITKNRLRTNIKPVGIGKGLRVKVNANIGTSEEICKLRLELKKLKFAKEAGADTVMDLSTGGKLDNIRQKIISYGNIPVGTVPIYQSAVEMVKNGKPFVRMSEELLFSTIEKHASDGVDFITVHCGVTQRSLQTLKRQGRVLDVVSRGGALTIAWMEHNQKENPLYEKYDRLLEIARKYELVLSLGDGLRPGCIADATDRAQIEELIILGELVKRAREAGVQTMVEGPGHIPLDQIEMNVRLEKSICSDAPFYVLGPLVTDIAAGYDHIAAAIGGALAGWKGADFLCYVTASEHLGLPTPEEVRQGVITARIAAHSADIARGNRKALEMDLKLSRARKALNWDEQFCYLLDPIKSRKIRSDRPPSDKLVCTMCGEFCAIKILKK